MPETGPEGRPVTPAPVLNVPPPPGYRPAEVTGRSERGRNLRQHERKPMPRDAIATEVLADGTIRMSWPCRVADLSRGGIGLISRRLAHRGTLVLVRVAKADGTYNDPVFGAVVHVRYLKDGDHHLGVSFRPVPARGPVRDWVNEHRG